MIQFRELISPDLYIFGILEFLKAVDQRFNGFSLDLIYIVPENVIIKIISGNFLIFRIILLGCICVLHSDRKIDQLHEHASALLPAVQFTQAVESFLV